MRFEKLPLVTKSVLPSDAYGKAMEAIRQAQWLADSSAEVHSILGFIGAYRYENLAGGIGEEEKPIRLGPHQPN